MQTIPIQRQIYRVGELTTELCSLLETRFRSIWVMGEISGLSQPASGHWYFSLKEKNSLLRCAFFRQRQARSTLPAVETGMQVLVQGQISLYAARGDLQLIVTYLEAAGDGALRHAFEILKQKLHAEGLFDSQHKRALPPYPRTVGVITSADAAALHDIKTTLARRMPSVRLVLYPALVQGAAAAAQLCTMLQLAEQRREVDVLIIARGGGSLEDLQAFNDEAVARAIAALSIPCISGVGHETDFTICDLVADHRAATPSAAAAAAVGEVEHLLAQLRTLTTRIDNALQRCLRDAHQQIDYLRARLVHPSAQLQRYRQRQQTNRQALVHILHRRIATERLSVQRNLNGLIMVSPTSHIQHARQRLQHLGTQLVAHINTGLQQPQELIHTLSAALRALSPQNTLARGFAILQDQAEQVITDASSVSRGAKLHATLARGQLRLSVED